MRKIVLLLAACALPLAGCAEWIDPPQSIGDENAGFRYVPIDPLPVSFVNDFSKCVKEGAPSDLLDALHDLSARVSVQQISGEAKASVPIFSVGASGSSYQVTQDFIAYDETPLRFEVSPPPLSAEGGNGGTTTARHKLTLLKEDAQSDKPVITIPVYVGVGLRLTANVIVRKGNVNLSDLGSISAAAKAEQIRGGLVAQTLGINGPKVTATLPLPGEINTTTIQNATVAIGAIKAMLHDPATGRWPRVVGIHYPFERVDQAQVNAIVSALSGKKLVWKPCQTEAARLHLL
jgi:hypothetical protein